MSISNPNAVRGLPTEVHSPAVGSPQDAPGPVSLGSPSSTGPCGRRAWTVTRPSFYNGTCCDVAPRPARQTGRAASRFMNVKGGAGRDGSAAPARTGVPLAAAAALGDPPARRGPRLHQHRVRHLVGVLTAQEHLVARRHLCSRRSWACWAVPRLTGRPHGNHDRTARMTDVHVPPAASNQSFEPTSGGARGVQVYSGVAEGQQLSSTLTVAKVDRRVRGDLLARRDVLVAHLPVVVDGAAGAPSRAASWDRETAMP